MKRNQLFETLFKASKSAFGFRLTKRESLLIFFSKFKSEAFEPELSNQFGVRWLIKLFLLGFKKNGIYLFLK